MNISDLTVGQAEPDRGQANNTMKLSSYQHGHRGVYYETHNHEVVVDEELPLIESQSVPECNDEEAANDYFNAILRASNGLTSEITFVQNQMSPCFA